jgi:arylsulfatase A-like enzyme/Tfp pilus assembly protein PilF
LILIAGVVLAGCSWSGERVDRSAIRNVIVITLDTTRADHLAAYGYKDVKTPNIDALAQRGVLFEQAITPVPLTLPSHTSIFTGQYPIHHGVRNNGTFRVPEEAVTMAEILKSRGFHTGAVIGAFVLDSKYGLDQGFDTYDDNLHGGKKGPMFMFDERPGRMVTDAALAWLKDRPAPFFLWLHYFDVHANYEPPPPFDVLYDKRPYDGEIAGVDQQVGRLLAALDESNRRKDTLVVLTADHGESLGEHGEATHSLSIYDATMHVPLLFSHPALPQGLRVKGQVRLIDILPTVLDLVSIESPEGIDGQSLVPTLRTAEAVDRESYIETLVPRFNNGWAELRGVRTTSHKYIRAPKPELYDLDADPRETQNLFESQPDTVDRLSHGLDAYLATDVALTGGAAGATLQLSAADRERLAALGYNVDNLGPAPQGDLPDPKDKIALWEEFQAAQGLMRQRKHKDAIVALRALLDKDPGNVMAHSSLATALLGEGQEAAAKEQYERVIALDPRRAQGRMSLARLYRRQGKLNEAFETLKEALANGGDEPEVASEFADLFQEAGNIEKSIEWYKEALRRDPNYVKALIGLSNTYHRAGRDTEALAALDQALQIDPRNADALYNQGVVKEALNKQDEAFELYRRALEIQPDHVPALNNLGSYYERTGDSAKAIAAYRRVIDASPDHFEAVYNLGTLALKNKSYEEAITRLEQARKLNPKAGVVYNNLALAYQEAGRTDDAIALLKHAADTQPKSPVWWLRLARVEAKAGRQADAKAHFEKAVQLGGESLRAKFADDPYLGAIAKAGKKKAGKS